MKRTFNTYRAAVNKFEETMGKLSIQELSREKVLDFKRKLVMAGKENLTNQYIRYLKIMYGRVLKYFNLKDVRKPFDSVDIKVVKISDKKSLSLDEYAIFRKALTQAKPGSKEFEKWVTAVMNEVETVYASLEPDDAYVHASTIKVNGSIGTLGAQALGMIDTLITKLERMAARATKQMPLLLGIDESTTDANANRQWEIQAAGIKSIQHLCETMLEHLLGLALQAQGIQATVTFRFAELRAAEMLRDAMTEQLQITNEISKYNQGWISQDAASQAITGHNADQPARTWLAGVRRGGR